MDDGSPFYETISEHLAFIDHVLSLESVPLGSRPMRATVEFVERFLIEVRDGKSGNKIDVMSEKEGASRWFFYIFKQVNKWYYKRYGNVISKSSRENIKGLVLIWGAPFIINIPIVVTKPGLPGKTVKIYFLRSLQKDENPINWLRYPPNFNSMTETEFENVRNECREVSLALRSITNDLFGVYEDDAEFNGLLNNVWYYLESNATRALASGQAGNSTAIYWNIQMTCECAFKALLKQKIGSFPTTHDLLHLYDLALPYIDDLDKEVLKNIPKHREMIKLRYGQSGDINIIKYYAAYNCMLEVIRKVVKSMVSLSLKDAWFEMDIDPFQDGL